MKQLLDTLPAIAFFIAFFLTKNFMVATGVLVGASALQLALSWLLWRRVEKMHVILFGVLLLLAAPTILLHDERFLKWKPTVVNGLFAVILWGSQWIGKQPVLQRLLEAMLNKSPDWRVSMPPARWRVLNHYAIAFFLFCAVLNLVVAYTLTTEAWVTFKVFGFIVLNLVAMIGLFVYLKSHFVPVTPGVSRESANDAHVGTVENPKDV